MARIRTIKPEFYKHEGLYDAEIEFDLPLRLAFTGLWVHADREGRFQWRPRSLKTGILPYDEHDFSDVLEALVSIGLIVKYEVQGNVYGFIPSFLRHQIPNRDEPPSEIPSVNGGLTPYDRPPNQTVRTRLYERDNYQCSYCQTDLKDKPRTICLDHIIPYSKGGTNREKNLVTSCKKCNGIKGSKTPFECGMPWPEGRGESYRDGEKDEYIDGGVNGGLTGGNSLADTERERERERERKGKGNIKHTSSTTKKTAVHFERFWAAYPKRVGKAKSLQIWKDNKLDEIYEVIVASVENKKSVEGEEIQFWKDPERYLKYRRWEDAIIPKPSQAAVSNFGKSDRTIAEIEADIERERCRKQGIVPSLDSFSAGAIEGSFSVVEDD